MKKILTLLLVILSFSNLTFATELETISPKSFLDKNPSSERKAIVDFIVNQFSHKYASGISPLEIENLWTDIMKENMLLIARFQIVNQKLYASSTDLNNDRFKELIYYFNKIIKDYKIADVDFIFYLGDSALFKENLKENLLSIPGFLFSKNVTSDTERNMFLFPDLYMIEDQWQNIIFEIEKANNIYPWNKKVSKLFWRGGSTGNEGIRYNTNNIDKLPRLNLVILSKLYPNLINAKFSNYAQFSNDQSGEDLKDILEILFKEGPESVPEEEHLKYKYLISIDGNTCAWRRVPWIMLSNSVLVKQETSKIEWFYSAMKPYVHYIPINKNLTNIFPQLEWMKNNDTELVKISQNATNFVKNNLMPEHIDSHAVLILNEYSKLHKGAKIIATLPSSETILEELKITKKEAKKSKGYFKAWKDKLKKIWQ
ncbi:MAG: glycosyl transferase family 90 [Rickettsiales bacterium]|jgi:hypothetical protein|nr:glycosyl transferase family 90 [Rickettsiales bacterium]